MHAETDKVVDQSLSDLAANRVRLSGYYSALAALALAETSPGEFDAEQVGIDARGQGVYVMFWRTPGGRRPEA